ncbi:hypothetical protein WA026_016861 [Henosepilachna vigintioctopunctata]|uniref:Uncharacterized protein n=1 Tax=Henosepilachna vigintioctopunctata TaxID=420089 RepID=A0AAW1U8U1_9CUCU
MAFNIAKLKVLNLVFMLIFVVGSLINIILMISHRREWTALSVVSVTFHIIYIFPCPAFVLGVLFDKRELIVPLLLATIHSVLHNVYLIVSASETHHDGRDLILTIALYIVLFIEICLNVFGIYLKISLFKFFTYEIKKNKAVDEQMKPYCLERFTTFY